MALVDPGTRSPGKLTIQYLTQGIEHSSGAWLVGDTGAFPTVGALATEAEAFATVAMGMCPNTSYATGWTLTDPLGVALYAENFDAPIAGTYVESGGIQAQSLQLSATGKGSAGDFTTKTGRTRTVVYTGQLFPSNELAKEVIVTGTGAYRDFIDFLRDSEIVGADKFGQKATYASKLLIDINSHYEQIYGL